jgi:hypothetical protein
VDGQITGDPVVGFSIGRGARIRWVGVVVHPGG